MCGRGRHHFLPKPAVPSGYSYIGHCQCGTGPHAYYQAPDGRIVSAGQLCHFGFPSAPSKEDLKTELEALKDEKHQLEKHIADLEKHLEEKKVKE